MEFIIGMFILLGVLASVSLLVVLFFSSRKDKRRGGVFTPLGPYDYPSRSASPPVRTQTSTKARPAPSSASSSPSTGSSFVDDFASVAVVSSVIQDNSWDGGSYDHGSSSDYGGGFDGGGGGGFDGGDFGGGGAGGDF